ncbi:aldose epimerase family protein [Maribacter sp.]|uniref:aldose epimerase family protein n=1 Tax=Maribacter sp. TaxID=1897614 RepID=UPI0025C3D856|nr:aldose epimerase family protein [Maribacter sp.]
MKQVTINNSFITLIVLDYGAVIQKILVKDKNGNSTNVVVGYDYPSKYLNDEFYLGACVGRYAGRISNGGFEIDREEFYVASENGVHLHGGKEGFSKKHWKIIEVNYKNDPYVKLEYRSKHLEEGYPGNLTATVTYKLVNNYLHITHEATTDRSTVINLTNHSYFRLDNEDFIDDYDLQLNCPELLETTRQLLPTGATQSVRGTEYDFIKNRRIGSTRLDTPFAIDLSSEKVGKVMSHKTGISMEVYTNQPAVVIYTPEAFPGICFETQNYPDAPNQKHFPNSILRPGEKYHNIAIFKFDLVH